MKQAVTLVAALGLLSPLMGESYPTRRQGSPQAAPVDTTPEPTEEARPKTRGFLSPLPLLRRAIPFKRQKNDEEEIDEFSKEIGLQKVERRGIVKRLKDLLEIGKYEKKPKVPGENITTDVLRNITDEASTLINAFVHNWPVAPGRKPMVPYDPHGAIGLVELEQQDVEFLKTEAFNLTGFKLLWKRTDLGELQITGIDVTRDNVLVETSRLELLGISKDEGKLDWVFEFEQKLDHHPLLTDKGMFVVSADILYSIQEPALGVYDWRRPLPFATSATPLAYGADLLVFGSNNGHIDVYNHKHKYAVWQSVADGTVRDPMVYSGRDTLLFSTDDGFLYNLNLSTKKYAWRFSKILREVSSAPVLDSRGERPMVFVGTKDQYLVGIDFAGGTILRVGDFETWEVLLSGPITETPVLHGDDLVLAISNGGGLHALDRKTATETWFVPGVTKIISKGEGEVYCLTEDKLMVGINLKAGAVRWSYDISPFAYIPKTQNEALIVLGTNSGKIFALAPPAAGTPFEDVELLKPAAGGEKEKDPTTPEGAEEVAPPLEDL